jgi:hypothetical protein
MELENPSHSSVAYERLRRGRIGQLAEGFGVARFDEEMQGGCVTGMALS